MCADVRLLLYEIHIVNHTANHIGNHIENYMQDHIEHHTANYTVNLPTFMSPLASPEHSSDCLIEKFAAKCQNVAYSSYRYRFTVAKFKSSFLAVLEGVFCFEFVSGEL